MGAIGRHITLKKAIIRIVSAVLITAAAGIILKQWNYDEVSDTGRKSVSSLKATEIKTEVTEYRLPDHSAIKSISIISKSEIYVFTDYRIYLFDGSKFKKLFEVGDNSISIIAGDSDGRNIAFTTYNARLTANHYRPTLTILSLADKRAYKTASDTLLITLPLSNDVTGIKFLGDNKVCICSILECCTLTIPKNKVLTTQGISLECFPVSSESTPYAVRTGQSYSRNFKLFRSRRSLYYCDSCGKPGLLSMLIDLGKKYGEFELYGDISKAGAAGRDFGWFCFNGTNYFFQRKSSSETKYYRLDTLFIEHSRMIPAESILRIITFSRDNIWAITKDGEVLRQIKSDRGWDKREWAASAAINNYVPDGVAAVDSSCIYLTGASLIKINILPDTCCDKSPPEKMREADHLFSAVPMVSVRTAYGAGAADFNNDGYEDLYIVNIFGVNELYLNMRGGMNLLNSEVALQRNITGRQIPLQDAMSDYYSEVGAAVGDFCEDGAQDIYITRLAGKNMLFTNNGAGYFKNATEAMNLTQDNGRSEGAAAADVNNDGYLDIFACSFYLSNRLYMNQRGAWFKESTAHAGLSSEGKTVCAAFGDIDNDGYDDLYTGNWGCANVLYKNNGDGTFTDITDYSGTGCGKLKQTNSVLFADFNNDGLLDIFTGNRGGRNNLFLNKGNDKFEDITVQAGLGDTLYTYGAVYGDFDSDGYLDLFISYLGGFKIFRNELSERRASPLFSDVTDKYLGEKIIYGSYNTAAVTADFDKDGDIDIFASQNGGNSLLLNNILHRYLKRNADYLEVKVEGAESGRDAVGARLKLFRNDTMIAYREICSGYGYASSSSKIQHFGLGDGQGKYKLRVIFPVSGVVKETTVTPNTFIKVSEYTGLYRAYFLGSKIAARYIRSGEFVSFWLKLAVFMTILLLLARLKIFRAAADSREGIVFGNYFALTVPAAIFFTGFFLIMEFAFYMSQSIFLKSYYYMIDSRNIIYEDVLPYLVTFSAQIFYMHIRKYKKLRAVENESIPEMIWTIIRRFEHGEGMLMNINRLSLFIKNIYYEFKNTGAVKEEILDRLEEIIEEYKASVLPELRKLSALIQRAEGMKFGVNNSKQADKHLFTRDDWRIISESAEKMLTTGEEIMKYRLASGVGIEEKELIVQVREFEKSENSFMRQTASIRESMKEYFSADVNNAVNIVLKKYGEKLKDGLRFEYKKNGIEPLIFFRFPELVDVLSIIVQNAAEESAKSYKEELRVRIVTESNNGRILIGIEDNGGGISEENEEKIFDGAYTTKAGDRGFGLRYIKECVEKYEGKISVGRSDMGGAKFTLDFRSAAGNQKL